MIALIRIAPLVKDRFSITFVPQLKKFVDSRLECSSEFKSKFNRRTELTRLDGVNGLTRAAHAFRELTLSQITTLQTVQFNQILQHRSLINVKHA